MRDIAIRSIRISGADGDLLLLPFPFHDHLLWIDFDTSHLGNGIRILRSAILDPFNDRLVVEAALIKTLVAGVRHFTQRLLNQRAFFRDRKIYATTWIFTSDAVVIAIRIEAKE